MGIGRNRDLLEEKRHTRGREQARTEGMETAARLETREKGR
jgi:hypothetical protein